MEITEVHSGPVAEFVLKSETVLENDSLKEEHESKQEELKEGLIVDVVNAEDKILDGLLAEIINEMIEKIEETGSEDEDELEMINLSRKASFFAVEEKEKISSNDSKEKRSKPALNKHENAQKSNLLKGVEGEEKIMKVKQGPSENDYQAALELAKAADKIPNIFGDQKNSIDNEPEKLTKAASRSVVGKKNAKNANYVNSGGKSSGAIHQAGGGAPGVTSMGAATIITSAEFIQGLKDEIEILKEKLEKDTKGFEFELRAERLAQADLKLTYEEKLKEKDKERSAIIDDKNIEIMMLNNRIEQEVGDVKQLEVELKKESEEFDLLTEALADKDAEVNKHLVTILNLKDQIAIQDKEIDRHKVIVHRLEKTIEKFKPPASHDVCLSARSYSEEAIIHLRDEDIKGKAKQIDMLTESNGKLLVNLDTIEDSVEKLQKDILSKNILISKLEASIRQKDGIIEKQEQSIKVLSGREAAMEVATLQNNKLLTLLQQQETKAADIVAENDIAKTSLKEFKQKYIAALKESAQFEALNTKFSRELKEQKKIVEELKEKTKKDIEDIASQAGEATRASFFKEQTTHEELVKRRESHYILLDRLTAAEETMRKAQDDLERTNEGYKILEIRNEDLERRLEEARILNENGAQEKISLVEKQNKVLLAKDECNNDLKKELDVANMQLQEMTDTVMKLVEKIENFEEKVIQNKKEMEEKLKIIDMLRKRMSDLLKESVSQGKARMDIELKYEALKDQLDLLVKEKEVMKDEFEKGEIASLKKVVLSLQTVLRKERGGRKKLISRYIKLCCDITSMQHNQQLVGNNMALPILLNSPKDISPAVNNLVTMNHNDFSIIDLSDSSITDEDTVNIRNTLLACRPLFISAIRLSTNSISDQGANEFGTLLSYSGAFEKGCFKKLDLSGNAISGVGAEILGESLKNNYDFNVHELIVHRGGMIEGIVKNSPTIHFHDGGIPKAVESDENNNTSNNKIVIDIRDNLPLFNTSKAVSLPPTNAEENDNEEGRGKGARMIKVPVVQHKTYQVLNSYQTQRKNQNDEKLVEVYGTPLIFKDDEKKKDKKNSLPSITNNKT